MGKNVPIGIITLHINHIFRFRFEILLFLLCLGLLSCRANDNFVSQTTNNIITFMPTGVDIELEKSSIIKSITVFDDKQIQISSIAFSGPPAKIEKVYFNWSSGKIYSFRFQTETQIYWQKETAPIKSQKGRLELGIPFLSPNSNFNKNQKTPVILLQKAQTQLSVQITNGTVASSTYHLKIKLPNGIPIIVNGRFTSPYQKWHNYYPIQIESTVPNGHIVANLQIKPTLKNEGRNWNTSQRIFFQTKTIDELQSSISIEEAHLPTSVSGELLTHLQPNTLTLPGYLETLLPQKHIDDSSPVTFQTIYIRNNLSATIPILVSAMVQDRNTKKPIIFLSPPSDVRSQKHQSFSVINLEPLTSNAVSLPLYVNPNLTPKPGNYQRKVQVQLWGVETIVDQALFPLKIILPNRLSFLVTVLATIWGILGLSYLIANWEQLIAKLSNKNLILISFFGAIIFGFVNLPSTFLISLSNFLLGPFSFLITAFFNEILYFTLLVALLTIVPQKGTIILVSSVRFLLNGILLGAMSPIILINLFVSVTGLEIGFWLAGKDLTSRLNCLILAILFGISDALSTWVDFQIGITFYRLFYADWYIWLMVGLGGFLYTFIGVLLGAQLGRHLQKVVN